MNVYLSPLAEKKVQLLIEYLEREWSTKIKDKFISILLEKFSQISDNPKSGFQSNVFAGLFKCVVTEQTSFFYRIKANEIEVITLVDNRQDPQVIEKEIKEHFQQ